MFRYPRAASVAAGLMLAVGLAGHARAEDTFVFGFVTAVPSGTQVSGARVDAVGVVDFFGRPVFDITSDSRFPFYDLFGVPSGEPRHDGRPGHRTSGRSPSRHPGGQPLTTGRR